MHTRRSPDPVTVEVIRNAFHAIADDMGAVLSRSAYSPVIYEMHDYGVAIFDAKGRSLGQAPGLPGFIGGLEWGVQAVLRKYGPDGIFPGDAFIINDSYVKGGHLSDVDVILPMFFRSDLAGFASSRAHWLDIGTAEPGFPVNSTSIFQEGLRLGATRVMDRGEWVRDIVDVLRWNTRMPKVLLGDLGAQVAAGRMAQRRYEELLARVGSEVVAVATEQILGDAETNMRNFISGIADGLYCAEAYSDDDFMTGAPIHVKVAVTVSGSEMTIDTTGSSRQATNGINSGYANTVSAARLALMFLYPDPDPQVNYGSFLPLRVVAEEGSIFAATEPAACMHPHPVMLMLDLVIRALAPAAPDRAAAGLPGDSWNVFFMGHSENAEFFVSGESLDGGWGACSHADGESSLIHSLAGDFRNVPVETLEARYPLLVHNLRLRGDSGGAGRFRGGLGIVKEYEALGDCRLTLHFDRTKTPQWGLFGGREGRTPVVSTRRADSQEALTLSKVEQLELPSGSRVVACTGGGGGFGNPLSRDPQSVLEDVLDGYVTLERAAQDYGVVLEGSPLQVEASKTATLRQQLERESLGSGGGHGD